MLFIKFVSRIIDDFFANEAEIILPKMIEYISEEIKLKERLFHQRIKKRQLRRNVDMISQTQIISPRYKYLVLHAFYPSQN